MRPGEGLTSAEVEPEGEQISNQAIARILDEAILCGVDIL